MSFLDSVVDFGKKALGVVRSDTLGGSLARTAILGLAVNKITKMINKDNDSNNTAKQRDTGVREQVDPDTNYSVPVIYGNAFVEGAVSDAALTNNKRTMWYCLTLCEQTGLLLNGDNSELTLQEVYWNGNRVEFKDDGFTVADMISPDGDIVTNYNGKVRIYPFSGNSQSPIGIRGNNGSNNLAAYDLFPNWSVSHTMSHLVFVIVSVDYDGPAGVKGLGKVRFRVNNNMKQPGDVLNDYMTNSRYGAGISAEDMNT